MNEVRRSLPSSLAASRLLAVLVVAMVFFTFTRSYAAVTAPNSLTWDNVLAAGATSPGINWPTIKNPMMLSGTTLTVNEEGTGCAHLTYFPNGGLDNILTWTGQNSNGTSTTGFTNSLDQDVVQIGFGSAVTVRTFGPNSTTPSMFRIKNNSAVSVLARVKIIY